MTLSRVRNAYLALVIAMGALILGHGLWTWTSADPVRYISFAIIAIAASGVKIKLLSDTTISMSFVFMLIALSEYSTGETLLIGCAGAIVQSIFQMKRPQLVKIAFSAATLTCSIQAAAVVHQSGSIILTALVLFFVNTSFVAGAIAVTEGRNVWSVWRDGYLWSFPEYLVGAMAAWLVGKANHAIGWQATLLVLPILYVIHRSRRLYVGQLEQAKRSVEQEKLHAEQVAALHRRTIETLALAIEAKDQNTHDHLQRVEIYAIEVGKELGLSPAELEALRAASLLHDIGKLAVPEYIISKPGKLTPDEFETMKLHTVVGAEIVDRIQFPYAVAPIVRGHHEKWDGTGYPDGLAGEMIPIGSRILGAVDCLDALASDRQYRRALPLSEAIEVVRSESGKSFDPKVVAILARRYVELEQMSRSGPRMVKLPTNVKIERGAAPAAGFEKTALPETVSSDLTNLYSSLDTLGTRVPSIAELAGKIGNCTERGAMFQVLRDSLRDTIPYDAMVVYLRSGTLLVPECVDGDEFQLFLSPQMELGTGLSGWVAETGKTIVNGNPSMEPGYLQDPVKFGTLRSALSVPLIGASGMTGVLSLYRREQDAFTIDQRDSLTSLGATVARVLEFAGTGKVH